LEIDYRLNPTVDNDQLDRLYAAAWPNHRSPWNFGPELVHLLVFVGAFADEELVGFVKLAWDGTTHAFLLEPTVHPRLRHRGIGRTLVQHAVDVARERGLEWVHVDYEPQLHPFYRACGFEPTPAGLIRLNRPPSETAQSSGARRAIVIFPELEKIQAVADYRKRWDPLADHIAPHLTLVFPFEDVISPDDLQRHVVEATRAIPAFSIRLSGVSGSEGEYIFVNVKRGNDVLVALHDGLYSGPLRRHLSLAHTYVPHVTIGRVVDRFRFPAALEEAARLDIDTDVAAHALSICTIAPNWSGHVEAEIPLT
jgi:2'-5' RNA ligase/predicted GNAT family acetyltransferase